MPEAIAARLIGSLFVERGLVSESQIRVALEIQRETGEQLGQILVDKFGVSRKELTRVVAEQWREVHGGDPGPGPDAGAGESWRPLGEIFVTRGFVSEQELDAALRRQRKTGERLGEALVGLGVISKFELAGALGEQMATLQAAEAEEAEEGTVVALHAPAVDDGTAEAFGELVEPDVASEPELEPEPAAVAEEDEILDTPTEPEPVYELEPELAAEEPVPVASGNGSAADATWEPEQATDVEVVGAGPSSIAEPEHGSAALVAYASTPRGYRLVPLDAELPPVGGRIHVPDVGELVVMRVGRSPLPLDARVCVFVEQPIAAVEAAIPAYV